jgi:hypothetical protein
VIRGEVWRDGCEFFVTFSRGDHSDIAGPFPDLIDAVDAARRGADDVGLGSVSSDGLHPHGLVNREAA